MAQTATEMLAELSRFCPEIAAVARDPEKMAAIFAVILAWLAANETQRKEIIVALAAYTAAHPTQAAALRTALGIT